MTSLSQVPAKSLEGVQNNWRDVRIWGEGSLMSLGFLSVASQVVESVRPLFFFLSLPFDWKLMKRFSIIHLSSRQIKHICSQPKIMQQWPNCVETWISLATCTSQTWAKLESGPVTRLYQGTLGLQESKSYLLPVLLGSIVKRDLLKY